MGILVQSAIIVALHLEYVLESSSDLDLSFSVKQDLTAANIIVSESLIMHVIKRP